MPERGPQSIPSEAWGLSLPPKQGRHLSPDNPYTHSQQSSEAASLPGAPGSCLPRLLLRAPPLLLPPAPGSTSGRSSRRARLLLQNGWGRVADGVGPGGFSGSAGSRTMPQQPPTDSKGAVALNGTWHSTEQGSWRKCQTKPGEASAKGEVCY